MNRLNHIKQLKNELYEIKAFLIDIIEKRINKDNTKNKGFQKKLGVHPALRGK